MALLPAAWGGKKRVTSASKTVTPVAARREPCASVNEQVAIMGLGAGRVEGVGRHSSSRAVEHGRQLRQGDRGAGEFASGTASLDDLFDGIARHLRIRQRFQRNSWSCR